MRGPVKEWARCWNDLQIPYTSRNLDAITPRIGTDDAQIRGEFDWDHPRGYDEDFDVRMDSIRCPVAIAGELEKYLIDPLVFIARGGRITCLGTPLRRGGMRLPGEEMEASSGQLVMTPASGLVLRLGRLSVGVGVGVARAICVVVMATFGFMGGPLAS